MKPENLENNKDKEVSLYSSVNNESYLEEKYCLHSISVHNNISKNVLFGC